MARVFIGIPTRNRPLFVLDAIRSVLGQTLPDFRLVVSDNASETRASESVARFVRDLRDPRVAFHRQPENVMEYGQGRFLLERCTEEYFAILHDDDRLEPGYLEAALDHLDGRPELACFVANPYVFDDRGATSPHLTRRYRIAHGRAGRAEGTIDVLESVLRCGFIPISGTLFRTSTLRSSGFVDEDCHGNYPFELNVLLRLGERGGRAYYTPRPLLAFRVHAGALRHTMRLKFNEEVISTVLKLLERRRFTGACERLRRKILSYNLRNLAMIRLARGEAGGCYRALWRSLHLNPLSYRNWIYSAGALLCPFVLRPLLRRRVVAADTGRARP